MCARKERKERKKETNPEILEDQFVNTWLTADSRTSLHVPIV